MDSVAIVKRHKGYCCTYSSSSITEGWVRRTCLKRITHLNLNLKLNYNIPWPKHTDQHPYTHIIKWSESTLANTNTSIFLKIQATITDIQYSLMALYVNTL